MKYLAFLLLAATSLCSLSQPLQLETMAGNRNFWYQHTISKSIHNSKWGFFNVSSLHAYDDKLYPDELMSQSYLNYSISKHIRIGGGTFYASVPGFKPSVNIQFSVGGKNYFLLAIPRIDVHHKPSYDMMMLAEAKPQLTPGIKAYSRVQVMFNYTQGIHNRSYQNIRLGIDMFYFQAGLAANFDSYGKDRITEYNLGLFIKKDLP